MNIVKRAIIMAAGSGTRLRPVTLQTPKPLIKVNGVRMIDTVIAGLKDNGIDEIHIVVGYLKDQFLPLKDEFDIDIIDNPLYDVCNNISSLYYARDFLEDSIIIDGDQVIYNKAILSRSFKKSGYNAVWTEQHTDEWLMQVKDDKVVSCSRNGGNSGWQLYSISRWTAADGKKLKVHLEEDFIKNNKKNIYWDDVVMFNHFEDYDIGVRPMNDGDLIEIDSIEELRKIDSSYMNCEVQ